MGWSVQNRVGFLSTIGSPGDLGESKLLGIDSYIVGSTTGFDSLGASSAKFSLFCNFSFHEYKIVL